MNFDKLNPRNKKRLSEQFMSWLIDALNEDDRFRFEVAKVINKINELKGINPQKEKADEIIITD